MEQAERRIYLLKALLAERPERYEDIMIPREPSRQRRLLRALFNVRPPKPVSGAFLRVQDAYLREELARKGITDAETLPDAREGICLWRGDITTLRCDAIVNAANSALLGCFDLADAKGLRSVAFCCISTGEFGFPNEPAAEIAVDVVRAHKAVREKRIRVIFNVFKERDENIYHRLLAVD